MKYQIAKRTLLLAGITAFTLGLASHLQAQVSPVLLFRDTYTVSEPTLDVNFENAARQSGTLAPLTYARSGPEDATQLGAPDAPEALRVFGGYVSPNHNFIEGGQFTIEFDVDPGLDDDPSDGLSTDWGAVVFGATTQNVFVNASDGMGILFRNNGSIEVWETGGQGAIYAGPTEFPGGIPTDAPFHVKIEVTTDNFRGSPATVKMFINDTQVRIDRDSLEHVKTTGFRGNYVTLEGLGSWTHVFDNLSISAVPCVDLSPTFVNQIRGEASEPVTVTIPAQLNTGKSATLTVSSLNPAVAVPVGADTSGNLTLTFAAGGPTSQTFTVQGVSAGSATLQVTGEAGVCVNDSLDVNVAAGVGFSEVVFQDTFETTEASYDINLDNSTRQTGTAGVLNYLEGEATAAGGAADDFTEINLSVAGKLGIWNLGTGVSPDYNFIEGPEFTIEFEVEPGANAPDRLSDNWAAIVFGSSLPNRFVNASDGMGILFRNDGRIEVWDGGARVFGSELDNPLPAGPLNVKIEVQASGFSGGSPATIRMFVNDQPVQISPDGNEHVKAAGFRGNFITLAGVGEGLLHTFDNLKVTSEACVHARTSVVNFVPGETSQDLVIKIPRALNTGKAAVVTVTSRNPAAATLEGAVDGVLTLTFPADGSITQTVQVNPIGKGRTQLELANNSGACVGSAVTVSIASGLVRNPSFEMNYNPAFPHYSAVDLWPNTGGTGVNQAGPFGDNGATPDRARIAFMQGAASLSQMIAGLTPDKKYWLQFRYNARGCCGGAVPDLAVRFDGVDLDLITGINPVGGVNPYYSRNVVFVPTASSGLLEFASSATGDATAVIDAVTIVQRDDGNVVVHNPSFEASGDPASPGVISPRNISGWTGTGTYGVNFTGAGPFADNGSNPDQDNVAFIQGVGSLSQRINGLVPGEQYTVEYSYNARSGNQPHIKVTANDTVLQDEAISAVGGTAAYSSKSVSFTAADSSVLLTFAQTAEGDQTLLLDNVLVKGKALVIPPIKVGPTVFEIDISQTGGTVTVTVPAELTATSSATITVTSLNPAVAIPTGAVDGSLDLVFAAGGAELEKTFTITPVGNGSTELKLSNRLGAQFENDTIRVSVSGSFVRNPSFENNSNPTFPGYGSINGWTGSGGGNNGLNSSAGPFHDNGVIPDRAQIALMQGERTIGQTLYRLAPNKTYWLQFYYNTRNCCGGTIDLTARFAGLDLTTIPTLAPVGAGNPYNFAHLEFTPTADSGDLEFATFAVGDATALLDAVSIVQRDPGNIVIQNPSFEASGTVGFPGYIQPALVAGWTTTGNYGVNVSGRGPFADNGVNSDQDNVLFLQGANASAQQTIAGLTPGSSYSLTYSYNARGGNTPRLRVTVDETVAQDAVVTPVGGAAPYYKHEFTFTAAAETAVLTFTQAEANGDNTVLIDNVAIAPGTAAGPRLSAQVSGANIRISWPESATGYILQMASVVTGGQWTDNTQPEVIEGGNKVVTLPIGAGNQFFRLFRP